MTDIFQCLGRLGIHGDVPKTVGALETALGIGFVEADVTGPLLGTFTSQRALDGDIPWLSLRFGWDMYHERPPTTLEELRRRSLLEFTVQAARGRSAIEQALRERFGPARSLPDAIVYELWIVRPDARFSDACWLSHHDQLPDWAVPPPDAAARHRFLRDLVAAAATADALDDLKRAFADPPAASGVVFGGSTSSELHFELVPPIAALELVEVLGWPLSVGQTADVHQSSWRLWNVVSESPTVVTAPPAYGRWNLGAFLVGRPTGGAMSGPAPLGGRHYLGPEDRVRVLTVGPY
jgi:hypothetical protein